MNIPFLHKRKRVKTEPAQAARPAAEKARYDGTLIARGLTKSYRGRRVVGGVSLVVRRGEAVTLTAYPEAVRPGAALPEQATLVVSLPDGSRQTLPMNRDKEGVFYAKRPAGEGGFEYRVEAALSEQVRAESDWHRVTAVEPVEIGGDTKVLINPPVLVTTTVPATSLLLLVSATQRSDCAVQPVWAFWVRKPAVPAFTIA